MNAEPAIEELSSNYLPIAARPRLNLMNEAFQKTVASFTQLGDLLQSNQIGFFTSDAPAILNAEAPRPGILKIGNQEVCALVFPDGLTLSPEMKAKVRAFEDVGETVLWGDAATETLDEKIAALQKTFPEPAPKLLTGAFQCKNQTIHILLNSSDEPLETKMLLPECRKVEILDPFTGRRENAEVRDGVLSLTIPARKTILAAVPLKLTARSPK